MASSAPILRPLSCCKLILQTPKPRHFIRRPLSTVTSSYRTPPPPPPRLPPGVTSTSIIAPKSIKTYPPPPSTRSHCPTPLLALQATQLLTLDPTSSRTRLFSRTNPDAAKVGDILLVRFRSGDPFAGVCMNIRRRGVDSSILLRNQLTRVGTELWVKIYSPNVLGVEVVQRALKRVRRARAYYFRKPKHDRGNVQGIVDNYIRTKSLLRSGNAGSAKGRGANAGKKKKGKK